MNSDFHSPNPFNIDIDVFDGPTPLESVVKCNEFNLLQQVKELIEQAHKQAKNLLQEAHHQAADIRQKAAQLGEVEKAQWMRQVREETHDAIVQEKSQWLIEQRAFEAAVISHLAKHVREMIASVLKEWLENEDQLAQLTDRLAKLVCKYASHSLCKLRLHPAQCESVAARLNHYLSSLDNIEYVADTTLDAGQAVIETKFLRIEFDLHRHWEKLLAAVCRTDAEELKS